MNETQNKNITIRTLSDKVEEVFQRYEIVGSKTFFEVANDWIGDKQRIISFKINEDEDNVIVVTEKHDEHPAVQCKYNIYRFFPSGTNWKVSLDLQFGTAEELAHKLLGVTEEDF